MTSASQKDCVALSKKLIQFAESEIAKKKGPFRISHVQVATYLKVSRSMVQAVVCGNRVFGKRVFEHAARKFQMEVQNFIEFIRNGQKDIYAPSEGASQLKMLDAMSRIILQMRDLIHEAEKILKLTAVSRKPSRQKTSTPKEET